jgi:hypothetical protein
MLKETLADRYVCQYAVWGRNLAARNRFVALRSGTGTKRKEEPTAHLALTDPRAFVPLYPSSAYSVLEDWPAA